MQDLVAAAIQTTPTLSVPHNFSQSVRLIRAAAAAGARLAVLPEYALTSWAPTTSPTFLADAVAAAAEHLPHYQTLAKQLRICIVPGTLLERDPATARVYNTAYFIGADGQIRGRYRKKNLWLPEREHLAAGVEEEHVVFDTEIGRVGLLVCWDLAWPEAFRELLRRGAELVVLPTFWLASDNTPACRAWNPDAEALFLKSTLVARAFENGVGIVFANAGGKEGRGWLGMSRIVAPVVGEVAVAAGCGEEVVVGTLKGKVLEDAEECYRIREDFGREGFHYSRACPGEKSKI